MSTASPTVAGSDYIKNLDPNKSGYRSSGFSWDEYIKTRPVYPKSFFERIFDYHATHSASWAVAHDVGAGAGIAAAVLATKFDHVHVSDPGPAYTQAAQQRLTNTLGFPASQFSFHDEGGEQSSVASGSVDLLVIAEAIHWCDIPVAMKEFARQLKSGGTVAISHYSKPILRHPKLYKKWLDILRHYVSQVGTVGGVHERATRNIGNGFDCVPFDVQYYKPGAKRIFINTGGDKGMIGYPQNVPDRTLPTDETIFIEGDQDWMQMVDTEYLKGIMKSFLTGLKDAELDRVWVEFEQMCGGKGAELEIIWPVVQLLGTRL